MPTLAILLSSTTFGLNSLNLPAAFSFVAGDLGEGISALGFITAGFLVGEGISQIPAGLASVRYGRRNTTAAGAVLASAAVLWTGFASSAASLTALRLLVGLGIGLATAPAISLVAGYQRTGSAGFAVGLFSAFGVLGSVLALVGDGTASSYVGWRPVMVSNGIAGILAAVLVLLIVPPEASRFSEQNRPRGSQIRAVLQDRRLLVLGLALLGIQGTAALCANFMVYYLESRFAVGPVVAGSVTGLVPLLSLPGTLIFGRLSDRAGNVRWPLLAVGLLASAGISLSALSSESWAIVANIFVGFWSGAGYVLCLSASRRGQREGGTEVEALRVSWLLSFATIGELVAPLWFSTLTLQAGYPLAWLVSGPFLALFLIPMVLARPAAQAKSPVSLPLRKKAG